MLAQFIRFCGVGVVATTLQYVILIALTELAHVDAIAASAIGFILSAAANFVLNYYFTFASKQVHHVAAIRFAAVSGFGLALNTLLMFVGTSVLEMHYLPAQVVATVVVLVWTFSAHRIWTYRLSERIVDPNES